MCLAQKIKASDFENYLGVARKSIKNCLTKNGCVTFASDFGAKPDIRFHLLWYWSDRRNKWYSTRASPRLDRTQAQEKAFVSVYLSPLYVVDMICGEWTGSDLDLSSTHSLIRSFAHSLTHFTSRSLAQVNQPQDQSTQRVKNERYLIEQDKIVCELSASVYFQSNDQTNIQLLYMKQRPLK